MATVTQTFIPGFRLIDGSDLNSMVSQINAALLTPTSVSTGALTATGAVSFTNASVSMTAIPTADPHVVGRLWANAGVLTISAG